MPRRYLETHPWITFQLDLTELDRMTWLLPGEAISKCDHIAGVPLQPEVAALLNMVYLTKGIHATTQIEGNTLSEEQVGRRINKELELPSSQEYLGQEIDNILEAYNTVDDDVTEGRQLEITPERVEWFNEIVLKDLPLGEGVVPGKIRDSSVLIGSVYRGAPAEDCEYLLERLCQELNHWRNTVPAEWRKATAIVLAIMAHLYLAWIHPFGDGNGRTARLIEYQLLVQAGAPTLTAHVLSDFYNRTRTEYYQQLARTSQSPYPIGGFLGYALNGFVDGLREQIGQIREQQMRVTWINYVHDRFHDRNTKSAARQRSLVLDLPADTPTLVSQIPELSRRLAVAYATKTSKTISRDVNRLVELRLIARRGVGMRARIMPRVEIIRAFLPVRADAD
jgi:Fic family protein